MASNMKTIVILIPYFGQLPEWFPLFTLSCNHNPGIVWHIFNDTATCSQSIGNVFIEPLEREQLYEVVSNKLGIRLSPDPYKLCDLRPAYGHIFEDVVSGYDFWGFGDIDVIYGDLHKYLLAPKRSFGANARITGMQS